ncbi:MAG: hypothetical protein DRP87_15440 [Spirochaetes bacterium]|nr:MAG: hypothetical protein DRP87_15440 [Spirochaetota bacterium]
MKQIYLSLIFILICKSAFTLDYSESFYGFNTEFDILIGKEEMPAFWDRLALERISIIFTWGPGVVKPLRLRGGLGYFPGNPFGFIFGMELPIFEKLNISKAKFFGLYLISDFAVTYKRILDLEFNNSLSLLLPLTGVGGVSIGAGITRRADFFIKICYMTGLFPVIIESKADTSSSLLNLN